MRVMQLAMAAILAHVPGLARPGEAAPAASLALAASVAPAASASPLAPAPSLRSAAGLDGGEATPALRPGGAAAGAISPAEAISPGPARWRGRPRFGLSLGAGFPGFATASLMYRPAPRIRLWGGPSWNSLAWGLHGGAALVPWSSPVAPVLAVEAGRFFRSDLSSLADDAGAIPTGARALLENVDLAFASVDVGVDLGSPRGFSVGIRAGLSYVSVAARGTAAFDGEGGSGVRVRLSDPSFRGTVPSAKLALQYWF